MKKRNWHLVSCWTYSICEGLWIVTLTWLFLVKKIDRFFWMALVLVVASLICLTLNYLAYKNRGRQ